MIRIMRKSDIPAAIEIYRKGIEGNNATFETHIPTPAEWDRKFLKPLRFVFAREKRVLGWIAFTPTSKRECYLGVIEVSVYVDPAARGQGVGNALMRHAIAESEAKGYWTIFSSIFPENIATLKLHEKCGFRVIGTREKIAKLKGRWRDTLILERRSKTIR